MRSVNMFDQAYNEALLPPAGKEAACSRRSHAATIIDRRSRALGVRWATGGGRTLEARLYELIRAYQEDRRHTLGVTPTEFHLHPLARFAHARPDLYPEYFADDGRLSRAVVQARRSGEIIPSLGGGRDDALMLRVDRDRTI